jgi:aspartate/tyrosine/aromatic aminotransferase
MFESTATAPPDPIFALTEAYLNDSNPVKMNLGAGVYRDEHGRTPALAVVKEAERRIWQDETSKAYLPIEGDRQFARYVQKLILGSSHRLAGDARLITVQTPGGTGGLRLAVDFLRRQNPTTTVWIPDPTWVNHAKLCEAAGLSVRTYPYLDETRRRLSFKKLLMALTSTKQGDVVLLHGCCHNPSGIDPTPDQWHQLAGLLRDRHVVPLLDFAYLGFGQGLKEDRVGVLALTESVPEILVCTSLSKNFALYNERVGALSVLTTEPAAAAAVLSQLKSLARVSYSNPPAHGAAIVTTIMSSQEMVEQWRAELAEMRQRIIHMRQLLVEGLDQRGVKLTTDGNEHLLTQKGMFSFSGLTPPQIDKLRHNHSIYIVGSGRVNFASMTAKTMHYLCDAIAEVMG